MEKERRGLPSPLLIMKISKEKMKQIVAEITEKNLKEKECGIELPDNLFTDIDGRLIIAEVTQDKFTIYGIEAIQAAQEEDVHTQIELSQLDYRYEVKQVAGINVLVVSVTSDLQRETAPIIEHVLNRLMVVNNETVAME